MSNFVPEGWRICNVDEFAKTSSGGTPNTQVPEYWSTGTVPWMSSGEVHKKRIKYVDQFISELGFKNSSAKLFPAKTILIALAGQGKTRGTVAISEVELTTNQSIAGVIVTDKTVFPDFVFHNLDSRYNELRSASGGSGRAGLNLSIIGEQELLLPPLPEQQKIATILSSVDDVIEKTRAQIDKLKDLKTGMMQELLTKGVGHTEFKDSSVGRIPTAWNIVAQGDVAKFFNGRAYKLTEWEDTGTPVIRLQNLTGSGRNFYYSTLQLPERQYCEKGDLLYMWSATFGPHIWQGPKAIYHYHIWKVEADETKIKKAFLFYLLDFKTKQWKEQSSNGMGILHVTKGAMEEMELALPPISEQQQIATALQATDLKLELSQQQLEYRLKIKKALMQDLLTGKVRVNLTDKESAVV